MTTIPFSGLFDRLTRGRLVFVTLAAFASLLPFASSAADKTEDFLSEGMEAVFKGNSNDAIAKLSRAIELDPKSELAYFTRGNAYSGAGDYDKALDDFAKVIEMDPQLAAVYVNRGDTYHLKGDFDKAIEDETHAIELDPQNVQAYVIRGTIYSDKGDYDHAISDFSQAIHPVTEEAANGVPSDANNHLANGTSVAIISLTTDRPYYCRGVAYLQLGNQEKARADFTKQIELEPNFAPAFSARGLSFYGQLDYDNAISDFDKAIQLNPRDVSSHLSRGAAFMDKHEYDKAVINAAEVIQLEPGSPDGYHNRAMARLGKGDFEEAIIDFNRAIQLDELFLAHAAANSAMNSTVAQRLANTYASRGDAYARAGNPDKALSDFNQAIQLDPKLAQPYLARADFFAAAGNYDKALADYNQAIPLNTKSARAYDSRARLLATCAHAEIRDGKKAVEDATEACNLSKWNAPSKIDTLAAAYAEAGDFDNAVKWESRFMDSPEISKEETADAQNRLILYQANKPYHAEK